MKRTTSVNPDPRRGIIGIEALIAGTMIVAMIVCGSLVPFRFDFSRMSQAGMNILSQINWTPSPAMDVITNYFIYIPVGITAYGWIRRVVRKYGSAMMLAGFAGLGMSLVLESMQVFAPTRCASWIDVIVNGAGAFTGAIVAPLAYLILSWMWRSLRNGMISNPANTLALILITIIFIHGLAPFDVVTDSDGFKESLLSSQWHPFAIRETADGSIVPFSLRSALSSSVSSMGLLFLLSSVLMLGYLDNGKSRCSALLDSLGAGMVIIVMIEVLQLFIRSRVFDTADILIHGFAVGTGAVLVLAFLEASSKRDSLLRLPVLLLVGILAVQIAWPVMKAITPVDTISSSGGFSRFSWLPFAQHFYNPFPIAVSMLIGSMLRFGILTACSILLLQKDGRVPWGRITMIVIGSALCTEIAQSFNSAHVPDVSEILLAAMVLLGSWRLVTRIPLPASTALPVTVR